MANYAKFRGIIIDDRTGASLSDSAAKLYYNSSGASPSSTNTIPIGSTSSYRPLGTTQKMIFGTRSSISAEYSFVSISVTIISPSGDVVASNNFTSDPTGNSNSSWDITSILTGAGATASQKPAIIEVTLHLRSPEPAKPKYTLSYNANGGSPTPSSQTVEEGTRITLAAAPTKSGYNFAGWVISGAKYAAGDEYTVNSNVTATAQWTQDIVYTVSFDKNSDEVTGDNIPSFTVTQGSSCILPGAVLWVRDKYAFVGWATTPGGTIEYNAGDPFTPTSNTVFFAVWSKDRGEGAQANYYSLTSKTTRISQTGPFTFNICSNVPTQKLALKYQTADLGRHLAKHYQYDPSFNPNPKVTTTSQNSQGATLNKTAEIPVGSKNATTQPTYVLIGIPGDYVSYYKYQRSNTSSDAYYSADNLTINTVCDDNWIIEAPDLENYEFVGWFTLHDAIAYGAGIIPTNADYTLKISDDRALKFGDAYTKCNSICLTDLRDDDEISRSFANMLQAQYIGKLVTVLFDATGGELDDFFHDVRFADPYGTLPTPIRKGYTFEGWFTAAVGGNQITADTIVSSGEDHALFAHWSRSQSNEITCYFKTLGSVSPVSKVVKNGSAYGSLPTPVRAGFSFLGWFTLPSGGTEVLASTIFNGSEDVFLYGQWEALKAVLTFDPSGGTCDTESKEVNLGSTIGRLPTAKLSGQNFDGWYTSREGGEKVSSSTVVNASMTLYARFKANAPLPWITIKISD